MYILVREISHKKILFLVQLPPPVHGASLVNKSILDSHVINNTFTTCFIDIATSKSIDDIASFRIFKIFTLSKIYFLTIVKLINFKPDLVYLTLSPHGSAFYKDAVISMLVKAARIKLVYHLHGKGISEEAQGIKRKIYQAVFKRANIIHLADSLISDTNKVYDNSMERFCVNNGVDLKYFSSKAKSKNILNILFLSNLIESKGAHILVKAVNQLNKKYLGKFQLLIAGKSYKKEYEEKLVNMVYPDRSAYVKFLGPVYDNAKIDLLNSSNIFVLPTQYKNESFPYSILEAMASSLAVISTKEGAIPEIVRHDTNGIILESANSFELTKALSNYLDNPDLVIKHGIASRELYEKKYTSKCFEKNLIKVLEKISC